MARFRVVLDACTLYPAPIRDLLMELTVAGLYKAHWTDAIHEEWIRNVLLDRPDLTRDQLTRTRELMDQYAEDALVTQYQDLEPALQLPDTNDRHVLAAAIRCHADAIVTFNLKDFPQDALDPWGLEAIDPDDFVIYQFDLNMPAVCGAAKSVRKRLRSPAFSAADYVTALSKCGLVRTAERFRDCLPLI